MYKYLNKGISTPIAISIILILAITVGIYTWWQYSELTDIKIKIIDIFRKEITCNEKCKSLGYLSGSCRSWAVLPDAKVGCNADEAAVGGASDCKIEKIMGGGKQCCCKTEVASFEDCVAKGYPVLESHPRQCETPDGRIFVEEIKEECSILIPKTIKLQAIKSYNSTIVNSDYLKIDSPRELCISSYPAEIDGYYLVQFQGPINEDYKNQVKSLGGIIDGYVPEYSFIVKMSEDTKEKVENLDVVQWVGIYQPAYKIISPNLFKKAGSIVLNVGIFEEENGNKIISEINSLSGLSELISEEKIRVQIDSSKIYNIANIVGIQYLEEYIPPEIF